MVIHIDCGVLAFQNFPKMLHCRTRSKQLAVIHVVPHHSRRQFLWEEDSRSADINDLVKCCANCKVRCVGAEGNGRRCRQLDEDHCCCDLLPKVLERSLTIQCSLNKRTVMIALSVSDLGDAATIEVDQAKEFPKLHHILRLWKIQDHVDALPQWQNTIRGNVVTNEVDFRPCICRLSWGNYESSVIENAEDRLDGSGMLLYHCCCNVRMSFIYYIDARLVPKQRVYVTLAHLSRIL